MNDLSEPRRRAAPSSPLRRLVVFSHLRWGFVFQRPQHLMSRLAKEFDVLFVEEPLFDAGAPRVAVTVSDSGVRILTPHTNIAAPGFHDDQLENLRALVAGALGEQTLAAPIVWLYTPMALPLLAALEPAVVVYDCMDELASFRFAPPQLLEREAALMQRADLVLTGGPSLYESRKDRHANIHCLPSAVDDEHFAPHGLSSQRPECAAARALHDGLRHPRIGFFGVIDERIDLPLVAALAERRPQWEIVMVGPVVKIDPASLPERPNLHWLGMQSYDALPYLLAQWDVCMLPFALNEATRFISPTKTLEYLSGDKPVVSTPIHDVIWLYGKVVRIGADAESFTQAIQGALDEDASAREQRRRDARALVQACTWDGTAARISALLNQAIETHAPIARVSDDHDGARRAATPPPVRAASIAAEHRCGDLERVERTRP